MIRQGDSSHDDISYRPLCTGNPDFRVCEMGNEIGNLSWSHPNFLHLSNQEFTHELEKTHLLLSDITGRSPTLLRPPYGYITPEQRRIAEEHFGYKVVLWNVDTQDWRRPDPKKFSHLLLHHG